MTEPVVTKVDAGYRAVWYPDEDVLRVFVQGAPEPAVWEPWEHGIERGFAAPFVPDPADEDYGDCDRRPTCGIRMLQASRRPALELGEVLIMIGRGGLNLLNQLRHGHDGLLKHLPKEKRPLTVVEAADALAKAVRDATYTGVPAHVVAALDAYDRARAV